MSIQRLQIGHKRLQKPQQIQRGLSRGQGKWLIGKQLALNEHSPSDSKSMLLNTVTCSHCKQSKVKQNSSVLSVLWLYFGSKMSCFSFPDISFKTTRD